MASMATPDDRVPSTRYSFEPEFIEGSTETHKLLTTPQHLLSLGDREAVAHVCEGRLGWPWVETVTTP